MLLLSLQEKPNWVPTHRFLASCYAHMGRLGEAREVITRLRNLTPAASGSFDLLEKWPQRRLVRGAAGQFRVHKERARTGIHERVSCNQAETHHSRILLSQPRA
jgi:hypothetical protein